MKSENESGQIINMNEKKIAFILCVNDMLAYEECKYYLDHLLVPDGYEMDVVTIAEAPSMTAGYNAGMQSTDARYKVYMHQDVLIVNREFIPEMLRVFAADKEIAMMGMIGTRRLADDVNGIMSWDSGKILHNCNPSRLEYDMEHMTYQEVEAVDGLLIATQIDVPWREDLFDGWDFYDISQCLEFRRRGKKVVVPYQKEPWVWHDNLYSKMDKYYDYAERLSKEYPDMHIFTETSVSADVQEYHGIKEKMRKELCVLVDYAKRKELAELFRNPANRGYLHLKEFQIIADIEYLESSNGVQQKFWTEADSTVTLLEKIRKVKYLLKRAEFQLEDARVISTKVDQAYSPYAVHVIQDAYAFR